MQKVTVDNKLIKEVVFNYPDASPMAKNGLKWVKEKMIELRAEYDFFYQVSYKHLPPGQAEIVKGYFKKEFDEKQEKLEIRMEFLKEVIELYKNVGKKGVLNVEGAKRYPIENLVEFNRAGFAKCKWHNEKTPSMKLYREQNRVWCFGCNQGGDVIALVMQMNGMGFREAVNFLNGND